MISIKKYGRTATIILLLVFFFSTVALANPVPQIKYVYFERVESLLKTKIVVIDYQEALDNPTTLYEVLRLGVSDALAGYNNVWLETVDGDIINYSKAIDDKVSYADAVANQAVYGTERPEPNYQLYFNTDSGKVEAKLPEPEEFAPVGFPDWLVEFEDEKRFEAIWDNVLK